MAGENSVITKEVKEEFCSEISRQDLLEEFRLQNLFCDFVIKTGTKIWNCHKVVLAATSPYFRTMLSSKFVETSTGEVEFPEDMSYSMDFVLKFMYTGSIKISVSNVVAVHRLGSYLLINDLVDKCIDFINRNFEVVSKSDGFLSLEWTVLDSIIEYEGQQVNEQCIWEAVMKWVKHDPENRSKMLPKLMEHVRFDLITPTYLCQNIAQDEMVKSSTECKDFIFKVLANHLIQFDNKGMNRSKSRNSMMEDMYIIGGLRDNRETINTVLKYNSQVGEWCEFGGMIMPLRLFGATVVGNNIYTVGGLSTNDTITAEVQMFDTEAKKWSKISPMNMRRYALGVCSMADTIYACGGLDSGRHLMDSVEFCDLGVGCWKYTTPMNVKRSFVKAVCLEGSIWAIGGRDDTKELSSVENYDPREGRWSHQSSMLRATGNHDAVVLDNKIYVCEGNSFEEYDPRNKQWRCLSPTKSYRINPSLVVNAGKIWAIGGLYIDRVEIYDRSKDEWSLGTPLPWSLGGHCAVILPHSS